MFFFFLKIIPLNHAITFLYLLCYVAGQKKPHWPFQHSQGLSWVIRGTNFNNIHPGCFHNQVYYIILARKISGPELEYILMIWWWLRGHQNFTIYLLSISMYTTGIIYQVDYHLPWSQQIFRLQTLIFSASTIQYCYIHVY